MQSLFQECRCQDKGIGKLLETITTSRKGGHYRESQPQTVGIPNRIAGLTCSRCTPESDVQYYLIQLKLSEHGGRKLIGIAFTDKGSKRVCGVIGSVFRIEIYAFFPWVI